MNPLDISILEELAKRRYASMTFLKFYFGSQTSQVNLNKRLRRLRKEDHIGKTLAIEPMSIDKKDWLYYIKSSGAKALMTYTSLYGGIDEIKPPRGKHSYAVHDCAAYCWLASFIEREREFLAHYTSDWVLAYGYQPVKQVFDVKAEPDAVLKLWLQNSKRPNPVTYLWELDCANETPAQLKEKFSKYLESDINWKNHYMLWVVRQNNPKRVQKLLNLSYRYLHPYAKGRIFATTLGDCSINIAANIWQDKSGRTYLPL